MDYSSLKTTADIIYACQECQNAGEQIDLFEALATSNAPPVGAFFEILKTVKFEVELALTIQAFGKITDRVIRENLKQSNNLLAILSEQAKSGQTDLIRWSAATTIENLGFDLIAVSRQVEPKKIADRIMRDKLNRLDDKKLLSSNDFDEYLNFWIYGNLTELKIKTAFIIYGQNPQCEQYGQVIHQIFSALGLRAIEDVNKGLERAESMGSSALEVDENEFFELAACNEARKQIENQVINNELITNQVHCLQSRNRTARYIAAVNLSKIAQINSSLLDDFSQYYQPNLLIAMSLIKERDIQERDEVYRDKDDSKSYYGKSYRQLKDMADDLVTLLPTLHRKTVKNDCHCFLNSILDELKRRKHLCDSRCKEIQNLKSKLDQQMKQIQSTYFQLYSSVFANNKFNDIPSINMEEDERYDLILDNYLRSLRDEASRLQDEITKFYGSGYDKAGRVDRLYSEFSSKLRSIKKCLRPLSKRLLLNNKLNNILEYQYEDMPKVRRIIEVYIDISFNYKKKGIYRTIIDLNIDIINIEKNEQLDSILNNHLQNLQNLHQDLCNELPQLKSAVTKFCKTLKEKYLAEIDSWITRRKLDSKKNKLAILKTLLTSVFIIFLFYFYIVGKTWLVAQGKRI
jgi:hypothetical protein